MIHKQNAFTLKSTEHELYPANFNKSKSADDIMLSKIKETYLWKWK